MAVAVLASYRRARRAAVGLGVAVAITASGALTALAGFGDGEQVKSGGYEQYEYAAGPAVATYDDTLYIYGTGTDGKGSYVTYDGSEWSDYYTWDEQPADFAWEPTVTNYKEWTYVFYGSEDGGVYHNWYDGSEWQGWENVAGDYKFVAAPYTNVYEDTAYLYGVADDGYLYAKTWDGTEWTDWAPVNEDYLAAWYQPYALEWGGYNNVFWTGQDGYVYWNRYSAETGEWTGAKQLPYAEAEYQYADSPYAIGYSEDDTLYAYAATTEGAPNWNTFDGESWSGWKEYQTPYPGEAAYQPHAYEYDGVQHLYFASKDGHAYSTTYDGAYGEWEDLGENYAYDPYSYEYQDGYYLTYTDQNGYLYYKEYEKEGGY